MKSTCPAYRLSPARRSTCCTTTASKPRPTWNRKYRPFTVPSPMGSMLCLASASSSAPVASIGSFGNPIVRANTFVDPPGSGARAVSLPASPLATSFKVPSPPRQTTTSTPSLAAPCASRVAWPRRFVSARVTVWSADSAFWITTRPRAVTDEADAFTTSSSRTWGEAISLHAPGVASLLPPACRPGPTLALPGPASSPGFGRVGVDSGNIARYEYRRLRQADTRPGRAGSAHRGQHVEARWEVDPRRVRLLRRRDGPPTGRQGGRGRGDAHLDGAQQRDLRASHRARHGRREGSAGQRRRAQG